MQNGAIYINFFETMCKIFPLFMLFTALTVLYIFDRFRMIFCLPMWGARKGWEGGKGGGGFYGGVNMVEPPVLRLKPHLHISFLWQRVIRKITAKWCTIYTLYNENR